MPTTPNFWLFQGKPEAYDFHSSLKGDLLKGWNVKAHRDKIRKGDKAIIWLSGKNSGCYALADIIDDPKQIGIPADHNLWNEMDATGRIKKSEDKLAFTVSIEITHNRFKNPILWKNVKKWQGLEKLKAGYRGTNFASTKEEYEIFKNLIESQSKS